MRAAISLKEYYVREEVISLAIPAMRARVCIRKARAWQCVERSNPNRALSAMVQVKSHDFYVRRTHSRLIASDFYNYTIIAV